MRVRCASRLPGREARLYFVDGTLADKKYSVSSLHGELFMFKHAKITVMAVSGCTFPNKSNAIKKYDSPSALSL